MDAPEVVLLDLDGVVWLAHQPIPGSVDSIARLRRHGTRVLFVTNNSYSTIGHQQDALGDIGIPAVGDVLTSAVAGARLVEPGERVLVCGGPGVVEAIGRRGAVVVPDGPCEAVMVGFHRHFDYEGMRRAAAAIHDGARLIGTNDDATYPTPDGPIPGGGAILAAIQVATGTHGQIAGKPYAPMAQLVREMVGRHAASTAVMVGDRPSTDGQFARELGCRYAHVWSGVTLPGAAIEPPPDLVGDDLNDIVNQLLGSAQ
jgi:HAD superfamily hydrolase (TIGR01450 family)